MRPNGCGSILSGMSQPSVWPETASHLIAAACNHCGAPLAMPEDARFVTCAHCGSSLGVERSGGGTYTHVLEAVDRRTADIEREVAELEILGQIKRVDGLWVTQSKQHMLHGKYGHTFRPTVGVAIGVSIFVCMLASMFFFLASMPDAGPAGILALLAGIGFVVGAIVYGISGIGKALKFNAAERRYQRRRQELLTQLERLGNQSRGATDATCSASV